MGKIIHNFASGKIPRFYRIWESMLRRCKNPNQAIYKYYGGKGIRVLWNNFEEFKNDMYEDYLKHCEEFGIDNTSIDRVDSKGNYCKQNCKWATEKEQARNTSRNFLITFKNQTKCCAEWAEIIGIKQDTLWMRFKRGWTVEKALTTSI